MKRRNFLKYAALSGVGLTVPLTPRGVVAQEDGYGGPYFIMINAGGGWDPRFLFDPTLVPEQNRLYSSIETVGNIPYAPIGTSVLGDDLDPAAEPYLITNQRFLERHGSRVRVLNGVDMETNNHEAGNRAIWSGKLQEGYPTLGALIAAARAPDAPIAFLSAGGYDATQNLTPLTRVSSADNIRKLAFPNQMDPSDIDTDLYHSDSTWEMIRQYQEERLAALHRNQHLPQVKGSMAN